MKLEKLAKRRKYYKNESYNALYELCIVIHMEGGVTKRFNFIKGVNNICLYFREKVLFDSVNEMNVRQL